MYFRDVSCHVQTTMQKTKEIGVYRLLGAKWAGIVVLMDDGRVYIEEECYDFGGVGTNKMHRFLQEHSSEIRSREERVYSADGFHIAAVFIRRDLNYSVYSVVCTPAPASPQEMTWLRIYSAVSYENTLLKNEVSQERELVQKVFESASIAIVTVNLGGEVVAANPAATALFNLPEPLRGVDILSLPWLKPRWNDILESAAANRRYARNEQLMSFDQEMRILNLVASPIKSNKDQVLGVVIVCSDDTEKVLLGREVEQLNQFTILGEIATGVAHDVRNPLMNIRCSTQYLQSHCARCNSDTELLGDIIREVDRINEVVEQMLAYGVIKRDGNQGHVDLNEIITQSIAVVKRFKGAKDIQFEQLLDRQVPVIFGCKTELQQAFINLLINAVQAIAEKGAVTVRSCYVPETENIRVTVEDTGDGIPYNLQGRLFKQFFSTKPSGVGVGLSIVKRVVANHNGDIKVVSEPGEGTSISVLLPVKAGELSLEAQG